MDLTVELRDVPSSRGECECVYRDWGGGGVGEGVGEVCACLLYCVQSDIISHSGDEGPWMKN